YTYLAGLGWAILGGAGLLSCWRSSRRSKTGTPATWLLAGIAFCVVVGLGVLTWNQVHVWHDSEKLWSHAVAIDPGSAVGQYSRGLVLAQQGKQTEAMEYYQTARRINRYYADAHNSGGGLLADQGSRGE